MSEQENKKEIDYAFSFETKAISNGLETLDNQEDSKKTERKFYLKVHKPFKEIPYKFIQKTKTKTKVVYVNGINPQEQKEQTIIKPKPKNKQFYFKKTQTKKKGKGKTLSQLARSLR